MLKFSVFYPGIKLGSLESLQNTQEVFLWSLSQSDYQPWERMEGQDQGLRTRFLCGESRNNRGVSLGQGGRQLELQVEQNA